MFNHLNHLLFQSKRLRLGFAFFVSYYLMLWLFWLFFRLFFVEITSAIDFDTTLELLYLQHKFNLRLTALIIIPILLIILIPRRAMGFKFFTILSRFYFVPIVLITTLFYIFNWGHYVYLSTPLDVSALRFLENQAIAGEFIWQSYPVITITLFWFLFTTVICLLTFYFAKLLSKKTFPTIHRLKKKSQFLAFLIVLIVIIGAIFGRFSQYPLRWSEAFFDPNPKVAHLAINPILYFFDTLKNKNIPFDLEKTKETYPIIREFLGIESPSESNQSLNYQRIGAVREANGKKYNLVFIMLESLGANRLGIFGNNLNPTPNLDRLAEEGYFFDNFFVPNIGTARTVYTSIFGIPDISPVKTASRNPLIIKQSTLMSDFQGYQKHYLLGGSASWANIRGMLMFNIADLNLYEGDYDDQFPKIDVWGISDTDLFKKADQLFDQLQSNGKPFIAYVQTAGNHRPFTIPEDNQGFEKITVGTDLVESNGFINLDQLNGVRFLDHNIGYFFQLAKESDYFEDTLFVLFGDHNDSSFDAPHMRALEDDTELDALHVPLIIYAPKLIEPMVFEQAASLVDVFPTMSYLANIAANNRTLGKNLLFTDQNHAAFTLRGNMLKPTIGVVQGDFYLRSTIGENPELYDLNQSDYSAIEINEQNQNLFDSLNHLSKAIYEHSRYLQYNNSNNLH